jgi:hypothetical protein
MATGYKLDDRGEGVRVPAEYKSSLLHIVKTGSGAAMEVKQQGCEADCSPPTSAEAKKMWICTSTPPYVFITRCLVS